MKKILFFISILVFFVLAYFSWETYHFLSYPAQDYKTEIKFDVSSGESFLAIARRLFNEQLISDVQKLYYLARYRGVTTKIQVGEYLLHTQMKPDQVLDVLISGKSIQYPFTVSEGKNMFEIADLLQESGLGDGKKFLELCQDERVIQNLLGERFPSLEGYLFPETYYLTKHLSEKKLIELMVNRFKLVFAEVSVGLNIKSRHKIVILSSIIEKETGVPEERGLVSSVFHNRLKRGMRLQTDPTVLYGIWVNGDRKRMNITRSDLRKKTSYNTYTFRGLPLGPIANPGRLSLEAALNPLKSDYLYFVSRNDGTHVFSKTYKEHNKAVDEYQRRAKARRGKSWRDYHNKKSDEPKR